MSILFAIFATFLVSVNAQRSPYAGARPASGYKDTYLQQSTTTNNGVSDIGNRDGELGGSTSISTTTDRLPYDAHGDAALVNHYNSLPFDQRPYWLVNQEHIEIQRGTPSRAPAMGSTSQTLNNGQNIVDRFNGDGQQPQPVSNPIPNQNVVSQQEVVYPSNITPDQRLDMEIRFLQQRLEQLLEQRRQLQAQRGQQTTQNLQNLQNLQNSQPRQRNF